MKTIGLTGGIGSGKSTVAKIFESLGIPVFNSDEEGRRLLAEDAEVQRAVVKLLGPDVSQNGNLDRAVIASKVFNDTALLEGLNAIIHPAVAQSTRRWLNSISPNTPYAIKEAAILFESGAAEQCDHVICVQAQDEVRIERIQRRDGAKEEEVRARMSNQWPQDRIAALSDFVIENSGQRSLIQQVLRVHGQLIS